MVPGLGSGQGGPNPPQFEDPTRICHPNGRRFLQLIIKLCRAARLSSCWEFLISKLKLNFRIFIDGCSHFLCYNGRNFFPLFDWKICSLSQFYLHMFVSGEGVKERVMNLTNISMD